ncbi:MAG: sigma-54-dependent Fis family transcriptional regulator [Candidatus Krumholzibacteriota bacterium]|nr:sigma-54-dependent Fis family transcriptional regulator [Candidatus Krumholzibacteriota bacterium]
MADEKILIVDDEKSMCQYLAIMLKKEGYDVKTVNNGKKAVKEISGSNFDLLMTDIRMEGIDGIEVLKQAKEINPTLPVIIMTAYASQKTAIDALNEGAFYYLIKRAAKNEEIKMVVRNALDLHKVKSENLFLKKQLKKKDSPRKIIGKSEEIHKVFDLIDKVADTDSTILVTGESGTGKELVARAIHYQSDRSNTPFVSINCGALPENLLESELFGHVKGSFTGAIRDKDGLFKVASGGTFFLDEVGETSLAIQVKLLRVLQEREIIPVGGTQPIKVNARLVAATNADLEEAVHAGAFRADLYYRLNVIPINIPPLRERRDDIPLLVEHFLQIASQKAGKEKTISKEAMCLLINYDWQGNVRELENVIERAVILQDGDVVDICDLPDKVRLHSKDRRKLVMDNSQMTLEELEKEYLLSVLEETNWQKKKASSILGINASTLYRKIQRYELDREEEKATV